MWTSTIRPLSHLPVRRRELERVREEIYVDTKGIGNLNLIKGLAGFKVVLLPFWHAVAAVAIESMWVSPPCCYQAPLICFVVGGGGKGRGEWARVVPKLWHLPNQWQVDIATHIFGLLMYNHIRSQDLDWSILQATPIPSEHLLLAMLCTRHSIT